MGREPKGKKTVIGGWKISMGSYPDWDRKQKDYVNHEKKKIKDIY